MLQDREYGTWAEIVGAGELYRRTVAVVQDGVLQAVSEHPYDLNPIVLRRSGHAHAAHYDAYPNTWEEVPLILRA
jgi:hypothetical protein